NRKSIGVEICYSKSGGAKYKAAEKLAIKFVAQLLKERGWGIDRVRKHQDWNGKYCPHRILSEGRWNEVKAAIEAELKSLGGKTSSSKTNATKKTTTSSSKKKTSYALPSGIYKVKSPMMKGASVTQIQKALAALYFYPDKGAKNNGIDGVYGPKTANAVKRFQLMHGLSADGIYGPKTKAKLEALL
ncbi:N-acetylmuramoyl-L-alanine amidase, partial [Bacillus sp. 1006-3]